jgi:hypothetical protein
MARCAPHATFADEKDDSAAIWVCLQVPAFLTESGTRHLNQAAFAVRDPPLTACM